MDKALEIAKVLVSPTMKLMDMVGSAIGTAYAPRHKRKMADATAHEIKVISEEIRNAADLPIVYNQDGVAINSEDFMRLMERAGTRLALQETVKQNNIEKVIDSAYETLEKEELCSEEPIAQGWINRFFDSVADISDADLQELWGKILAGEIIRPKTYSLRTLETLKNLSKDEAELFQKIAPFIISIENEMFLPKFDELLNKYEVYFSSILSLDECGLINSDGMVTYTPEISTETSSTIHNSTHILFVRGTTSNLKKIYMGIYSLTRAGKELYSILNCTSSESYMTDLAEAIEKQNQGDVSITLHQVQKHTNDGILYNKIPLKSFPKDAENESMNKTDVKSYLDELMNAGQQRGDN